MLVFRCRLRGPQDRTAQDQAFLVLISPASNFLAAAAAGFRSRLLISSGTVGRLCRGDRLKLCVGGLDGYFPAPFLAASDMASEGPLDEANVLAFLPEDSLNAAGAAGREF